MIVLVLKYWLVFIKISSKLIVDLFELKILYFYITNSGRVPTYKKNQVHAHDVRKNISDVFSLILTYYRLLFCLLSLVSSHYKEHKTIDYITINLITIQHLYHAEL